MTMVIVGNGGNLLDAARIVSILRYSSKPVRRLLAGVSKDRIIDATAGKRIQSLVTLDTGEIYLSSVDPKVLGAACQRGGV